MLGSLESLVSHFTRNTIMSFYYAVAKGRMPGIYHTWEECNEQVHKFRGPVYKKFPSEREALEFINVRSNSPAPSEDLVTLGRNRVSDNAIKRALPLDETSENNVTVGAKKRFKTVESNSSSSSCNLKRDNMDFQMDPKGFVDVYTDGACSKNGYSGAKAGVGVYFGDNSPLNVSAPVVGRATNNMAEIQAVTRAAGIAREAGMTKLRIHTDSDFVIKCITQWMRAWKKRDWRTVAGQPVINKVELLEMEAALESLQVEWVHVRGHQGIHGNEMADKLARQGAEKYRSH